MVIFGLVGLGLLIGASGGVALSSGSLPAEIAGALISLALITIGGVGAIVTSEPLTDAMVDLLRDWSGVTDEAGQSMPFSPDSARQLLNMPGLASLAHATYLREVGAKEKN
jgi:hypothetical protein